MIVLHKFVPAWQLPDTSPFCIKVETYLRMAGLQYEVVGSSDPRRAPKQKCPFIEHNGTVVSDSSAIIMYLENLLPAAIDKDLDARQRAISAAFRGLIEEHFYFVLLWDRWVNPAGWNVFKPLMQRIAKEAGVPSLAIPFVLAMFRRRYIRTLWGQGVGRHSPAEIEATGAQHLRAISAWLDGQDFMLGPTPHTIDATVYAFLISVLWTPIKGTIKTEAERHANLSAYCERMKNRFWPN